MHFLSDAIAEIEGLLEVNRDFCKKQMAEKAIAIAADELCGIAQAPTGMFYKSFSYEESMNFQGSA